MENQKVNSNHLEIETKYRVEPSQIFELKSFMDEKGFIGDKFLYVESYDTYYVREDGKKPLFLRHRYSKDGKTKRAELTYKIKKTDDNNLVREEVNLRVDHTSEEEIAKFAARMGYKPSFSIKKFVNIYFLKDVVVAAYTVNKDGKMDHYVEIEAREDLDWTAKEAWEAVRYWEKVLEPVGINHNSRLKKSLYEIYA